jgi:hypothetical protein
LVNITVVKFNAIAEELSRDGFHRIYRAIVRCGSRRGSHVSRAQAG